MWSGPFWSTDGTEKHRRAIHATGYRIGRQRVLNFVDSRATNQAHVILKRMIVQCRDFLEYAVCGSRNLRTNAVTGK